MPLKKSFIVFLFFGIGMLTACQKVEPSFTAPDVTDLLTFEKRVLIEPTVSTSCGACPLMHHEIESMIDSLEPVIHMNHYTGGPMHHPFTNYILKDVNKTVYTPLAHVNRAFEEGSMVYYPVPMVKGIVSTELLKEARYALRIETHEQDGQHKVRVSLYPRNEADLGALMLHVFIVEKTVSQLGPEYDQRNYGNDRPTHPYYSQGNWIEGFVHTNVIRAQLTPEQGEEVRLSVVDLHLFDFEVSNLDAFTERPTDFAAIVAVSKPGEHLQPILNADFASF